MLSVETLKEVIAVLRKADKVELIEQVTDLREEVVDVKEQYLKLKEENASLREQLSLKSKVVFKHGICWIIDDDMTEEEAPTPICPNCWQFDKVANRLPTFQWDKGPAIRCTQDRHGLFEITKSPSR